MKAWKQMIMQEVLQELQAVRQAYEEAIETQRHDFRVELEGVNERMHQVEAQSTNQRAKNRQPCSQKLCSNRCFKFGQRRKRKSLDRSHRRKSKTEKYYVGPAKIRAREKKSDIPTRTYLSSKV